MANDFVNTITTSNGTTYDVQDKRLTVTAADAGKVVSVDSNGNLSLVSGGTKLYKHTMGFQGDQGNPIQIRVQIISTNSTTINSVATYQSVIANAISNLAYVRDEGDGFSLIGELSLYGIMCISFDEGAYTSNRAEFTLDDDGQYYDSVVTL